MSRSLSLAWIKCAKISTCWKPEYLIATLAETTICVLEPKLQWILARLQLNKNVGSTHGLTSWKCCKDPAQTQQSDKSKINKNEVEVGWETK